LGPLLRQDGGIIRGGKSIAHIAFLVAEEILDQREVEIGWVVRSVLGARERPADDLLAID